MLTNRKYKKNTEIGQEQAGKQTLKIVTITPSLFYFTTTMNILIVYTI